MTKEQEDKRYMLFSSGTEFMFWQSHNCEKCVKAVFYNEKKDTYPQYRCAIQKHIEEACIGDGCGNKRTYDACRSWDCPHKQTTRIKRKKKKTSNDKKQLNLFCDE